MIHPPRRFEDIPANASLNTSISIENVFNPASDGHVVDSHEATIDALLGAAEISSTYDAPETLRDDDVEEEHDNVYTAEEWDAWEAFQEL
ncbi:hypothetical protein CYMTET_16791 [Cymbomonas tetramitiformis]|uniref:Uncharacterized protein n=1 Tax=Cymbomonas tetramitiformis TaxID=36881 RepID=A0AAE0L7M1_9CHLO|nr:hypothetical protein CYMTET_16791 [Cymbomonas tetramitiformis]